jgi:aspartate racemase
VSRTIGLIGGMSWESTATYYRAINEIVRERHGGLASADILLHSVNFEEIVALQKAGRWDLAAARLGGIASNLASIGASCILICTNTMHLVADGVAAQSAAPLIHIVDTTGAALNRAGIKRPLLLATKYTMEEEFYLKRLREKSGLDALVPEAADRDIVHNVIFDELCKGIVKDSSRDEYIRIIERGRERGADAVILGCTEIGLLVSAEQSPLPAFDSTLIHATAAVDFVEAQAKASLAA